MPETGPWPNRGIAPTPRANGVEELPPIFPRSRTDIENVVRAQNHIRVVFDHHDRVPALRKSLQDLKQPNVSRL